jgi:uncharacterized membrane protein
MTSAAPEKTRRLPKKTLILTGIIILAAAGVATLKHANTRD